MRLPGHVQRQQNDSRLARWFGFKPTAGSARVDVAVSGLRSRLFVGFILGVRLLEIAASSAEPGPSSAAEAIRRPVAPPANGAPGFTRQTAAQTGVGFSNFVAQSRHLTNQIYLNGSGVAAGDVDGDGRCDLYFCGLDGPNALYLNRGGWRFDEVGAASGVACPELDSTGAALADLDGDGDLDLLVNTVGQGTHLYLNDGKGVFREADVSRGGLNRGRGGMSMALADIDGDGDLDVYIANYRTVTIRDQPNTNFKFRTGGGTPQLASIDGRPPDHPDVAGRFEFRFGRRPDGSGTFSYDENGEPDVLLRNEGGGRLVPVPFTNGVFLEATGRPLAAPPLDWGLAALFRDLNGDGAPDLYVCNDFRSPDRIWFNDGHGHFRLADPLAFRQSALSSMGVDVADINRDGFVDIFVADMLSPSMERRLAQRMEMKPEPHPVGAIDNWPQSPRNMLFVNRGDGTWAELAQWAGVDATDWTWTPAFLDVDLDGYEDLLVSNGFERDGMNADAISEIERAKRVPGLTSVEQLGLRRRFPRLATPNIAFRNLGNLRFEDVSARWGFDLAEVSQGMALADLDDDGDLDVVINNFNAPAALYRNNGSAPRVSVRLRGAPPNTRGIGARVTVRGGAVPLQSQEIVAGGRYLSSDDAMRTFAAGTLTNRLTVEVAWRSGARSVISDVLPNSAIEVFEPRGPGPGKPADAAPQGTPSKDAHAPGARLFVEHAEFRHRHHEEAFDDFALQPALPSRLSQLGPGVAWFDLDGDHRDDLIVGSGRGGAIGVFRNDGNGGFKPMAGAVAPQILNRDATTVIGWRRNAAGAALIAGLANYEDGTSTGGVARILDSDGVPVTEVLPRPAASTGPLAMADYSGDGTLDLFIGGRVIAGQFPRAASSLLLRGDGAAFQLDETASEALSGVGLVSGAVFTDLDGDGRAELVLACQWDSLKVFREQNGRWTDHTTRWGLDRFRGLWNGVTAGDFDGDGRLDLAASNWGRNSRYERFRGQPLRLVYDADVESGQGAVAFVEAWSDAGGQARPLVPYQVLANAMPSVRERLPTYTSYARATVPEVFGDAWKRARQLEANWMESTVFLNRGDHFEPVVLPDETQWAPAFGIGAADLDGDGHEDLFVSQNLFAVPAEQSRYDAGRGLWLRGNGAGRFEAVPADRSGLNVYGEQRGAAFADYDADGRTDLVITQNGGGTTLYRNALARPGIRVRLKGPPGNPDGIGAVLRVVRDGGARGPARELHAGSGYWSQDSSIAVVGPAEAVRGIWIRWPGGRTGVTAVPPGTRELVIASP